MPLSAFFFSSGGRNEQGFALEFSFEKPDRLTEEGEKREVRRFTKSEKRQGRLTGHRGERGKVKRQRKVKLKANMAENAAYVC